jgi:hypothetical protein
MERVNNALGKMHVLDDSADPNLDVSAYNESFPRRGVKLPIFTSLYTQALSTTD